MDVSDAEVHFTADQYMDHSSARKPVLSISPNEIYAMHDVLVDEITLVVRTRERPEVPDVV
jgi:Ras GTPase-activating-like protein IQGAP2/3